MAQPRTQRTFRTVSTIWLLVSIICHFSQPHLCHASSQRKPPRLSTVGLAIPLGVRRICEHSHVYYKVLNPPLTLTSLASAISLVSLLVPEDKWRHKMPQSVQPGAKLPAKPRLDQPNHKWPLLTNRDEPRLLYMGQQ